MDRGNETDQETPPLRVRGLIERLVAEGSLVARSDGSVHRLFPTAIPIAEGNALRDRVVIEGAGRTIETGLGYGLSALFICEGLLVAGDEAARHLVIDPYQQTRFADCGLQLLEEAGVRDLVEFRPERSQAMLPKLLDEGRNFDLAFVDGDHRFDGVFVDLFYLGHLVRPGGIVFMDDYQLPGVERAASYFVSNLDWTLEDVSPHDEHHQWAVLSTPRTPDTRPFDYYIDF